MRKAAKVTSLLYVLVLGAAACNSGGGGGSGDPAPGDAFLTIVGNSNLMVELGGTTELRVRYHDGAGDPLAGEVSFVVTGMTGGSTLSATRGVTDANGQASVRLTAGTTTLALRIVAEAAQAAPVEWRVSVGQGVLGGPGDLNGSYRLDSQFDHADGMPGRAGRAVAIFTEMTDGPNDPATWVLDALIGAIDSSVIRGLINVTRPALDGYLADELWYAAPDLVDVLSDVGTDFSALTHRLGMRSSLAITPSGGSDPSAHVATHVVTGFHWTLDGVRYEYTTAEMGLPEIKAEHISVTESPEKIVIAEHSLPVPYGQVLVFILNRVLIPTVVPFADSLEDLLSHYIDCAEIGWRIWVETDFGNAGMYQTACQNALHQAQVALEDELRGLDADGGSGLVIHGDTRGADTDSDARVDRLMMGYWEGTFRVGGETGTLARPDQQFLGERITTP